MAAKKKSKTFTLYKKSILACAVFALACALLVAGAYLLRSQAYARQNEALNKAKEQNAVLFRSTFYPGVTVEGIDLSQTERSAAAALIRAAVQQNMRQPYIHLAYKEQTWAFEADRFTVQTDIEAAVEKAWAVGRTGTKEERLAEIAAVEKSTRNFSVTAIADPGFLHTELEIIKAAIDRKAKDATVTFSFDSEARYHYTADQRGVSLDVEKAYNEILVAFSSSNQVTYELKPEAITANVELAEIQRDYKLIARFSTDISNASSQADRKVNILLSLKQFDNYVIMPGQTMSFNQTTGERTLEKGYRTAVFINTDQVYDETAGGGVCQSSTTLYNAALLAGATPRGMGGTFEIVRRYPHSWPSIYAPAGQDASVNWPSADLLLRNNRQSPMFFRTYSLRKSSSYDSIVVEIYGEELPGTYTIESTVVETIPCTTYERKPDTAGKYTSASRPEKIVSEPRDGKTAETYQIFTAPGQEPIRKLLYTTVYQPIPGKIYYRP